MSIKKIGIIWADPLNRNFGVAALAWASAELVRRACILRGLEYELHFFGCNNSGNLTLRLSDNIVDCKMHSGFSFKWWRRVIKEHLLRHDGSKALRDMDIVFDLGAGDSFSDIYGNERLQVHLASKKYLYDVNVKQIFLPQTIGPFTEPKNETKARKALSLMAQIYARDKTSFLEAQRLTNKIPCHNSIDVAFALPWKNSHAHVASDELKFGLNISGLLWSNGYQGINELGLAVDYRLLMHEVIKKILETLSCKIVLVPHVFGQHLIEAEDDLKASIDLKNEFNDTRISLAPEFHNPCDAKSFISTLDFFSGARMHACIAAFSSGVPVIPMAYSRKFNGLFCETLEYPWLIDLKATDIEQALNKLTSAYYDRDCLKKHIIRSEMGIVKPLIDNLITEIGVAIE